jgi:hypothetical protein
MKREEAIQHIENLYPADSQYENTAKVGRELLEQAKRETAATWKTESTEVLIRYAQLCLDKDKDLNSSWMSD